MPRQEHVLTVFVASPGDVGDERAKLEEVIRELNITWSRELGIRIDLARWETHAYPGMGDDAQDVINAQIPDDYDLFVGVLWCRYGTSTHRSGSGTIEEFERAKARYDSDPSSVKLMMYFKDEPISPSHVNPAQLAKVNDFRASLGEQGALYWTFNSLDQFEKLIRVHLTRQIQTFKSQLHQTSAISTAKDSIDQPIQPTALEPEPDDLGVIDLFEIFEDRFAELTNIAERIGKATEELGSKMRERNTQISELPRDARGNANRNDAKRLISLAAADMDQYTARIEAELPLFGDSLNTGMNSFIRAVTISMEMRSDEDLEEAKKRLDALVTLRNTLISSQQSMREFREIIADLPRMTSILNKSKRGVVSVLDKLIADFDNGQTLTREAETLVREVL